MSNGMEAQAFKDNTWVNEWSKAYRKNLGQDRMLEILNEHQKEDDRSLCETIVEAVDRHVGEDPQFDDITVIKSFKEA